MRASMSTVAAIVSPWLLLVATNIPDSGSVVTLMSAPTKRTSPASTSASSWRSLAGGGPLA